MPKKVLARPTLFHAFLLASAALIGAAALVSGLAVGRFFERHIVDYQQEQTVKLVQSQAAQHLVAADFERPRPQVERHVFEQLLAELPGVFRIKVYDRTGRIVWSDEPRLVGTVFPDDSYLAKALRGEVAAVLQVPSQPEHLYERTKSHVAETYVPIVLPGSSELVGVLETYQDTSELMAEIRGTQRLMWGSVGGIGFLLYAALAFVVWRASVREARATRRLQAQNRELTLIYRFTRSVRQPLDLGRLAASVVESAGMGLDLSRAALYRVSAGHEPVLLAGWPEAGPAIPTEDLTADALETRRPVSRDARVAFPVLAGKDGLFLLLAELKDAALGRELAAQRALEILLDETAMALANVELFTEIREAHERLAAILAGIADRMLIVDRQMRVVWLNGVARESVGGAEVLGRPCFEVLEAEGGACQECPAARTFHFGMVERGLRAQRLPSGEVRYLDLVTAPLRDASGQVHQVLEVARDITEMVAMEERLKQSAARLERSHAELVGKTEELEGANRALRDAQVQLVEKERLAAVGQVVVGLHHAILNPLAGILGALQVLKADALLPAAKADAFAQAEAEIRKIERLIRRLPGLPRAAGTPYVGDTTMLDLDPSAAEAEPARSSPTPS